MPTLKGEQLRRDPGFPRLKSAVIARIGLSYWDDKDEALAEAIARLLEARHLGPGQFAAGLAAEAGHGPLTEALTDAVTVGETFFFRYPEQFAAVEKVVMPDLLWRNRQRRAVRLWSAGCSNGAEPYSLAILLARQFGVALAGWEVDILGTDVNRIALAEAQEAEYGEWTVRGMDPGLREQCFTRAGERWRLLPLYRKAVRFAVHNLVSSPPPVPSFEHFDIVVCRNVLMYFAAHTRRRVLEKLAASLAEGGWLLVGHAEVGPEVAAHFETVVLPDCTLYRKAGGRRGQVQ